MAVVGIMINSSNMPLRILTLPTINFHFGWWHSGLRFLGMQATYCRILTNIPTLFCISPEAFWEVLDIGLVTEWARLVGNTHLYRHVGTVL